MATVYSSWVKGSTGSNNWRVRLDYTVSYPSATTAEVELTAYVVSTYGWTSNLSTRVTLKCGGSSYSLTGPDFPSSSTTKMGSHTFTVSRGSSSKSVAVSAKCWVPSGATAAYRNGATASGTATVSKIDYSAPNAPTGCSASRESDAQAKVTWKNGSTSTTKPRSSTKVERQTDSGSWSQIASVGSSTANYTDNGISANHRYRYRVRAYGAGGYSAYATSDYIYTTPAAPTSVAASKSGEAAVTLSIEGAAPWAESYAVERSTDGGSQWVSAGTAESFPWVDSDAPAGTVVYRVAAVRGSLQSAWAQSNAVTTITPPLAPTVTGLPNVAATGSALTASWVPNHPDGSAQTSAEVEYAVGDGSPQTATVEGASTSYVLPESATAAAGTVKVRVRTHGLDPDWGAWSAYSTVAVAVPPSAHFTNPASDGATVAALPLVLAWEAADSTGIASQTLSLMGADGSTLLTRQLAGDVRSFQIDDSVYSLSNLADYSLVLTVLGGSSLSATAERDFTTDWAEPAVPEAWVEVDPDDLSCAVTVHAGGFTPNMWINPASDTNNGVTLTVNDDGSLTIGGTSEGGSTFFIVLQGMKPATTYTLSIDNDLPDGTGAYVDGAMAGALYQTTKASEPKTFETLPGEGVINCGLYVSNGIAVSGTYRVMLNEGTEPAPWQPPGYDPTETMGLSVIRVLPDGSQWLVADGLASGEQCIDPLPPLNVGFTYRVTASSAMGTSSVLEVPTTVETRSCAFNFGAAASTSFLAVLNPSWSNAVERASTLYHFADGGEAGGLPVAYGGQDVDSTRSAGFTLLDPERVRELQALAAAHAVCWFRDLYGGRALCAVSWSLSSGVPYRKVDVSVSLTDTAFEEAW